MNLTIGKSCREDFIHVSKSFKVTAEKNCCFILDNKQLHRCPVPTDSLLRNVSRPALTVVPGLTVQKTFDIEMRD